MLCSGLSTAPITLRPPHPGAVSLHAIAASLRVSTGSQDLASQKLAILDRAHPRARGASPSWQGERDPHTPTEAGLQRLYRQDRERFQNRPASTLLTRGDSIPKLHNRGHGLTVLKGYFCSNLGGTLYIRQSGPEKLETLPSATTNEMTAPVDRKRTTFRVRIARTEPDTNFRET